MPAPSGYRSERLRRRRRSSTERRQAWVLYVLAAAVAFAAVLGAWYAAGRWVGAAEEPLPESYLVLLKLISPSTDRPVASALAIKEADGGSSLYVIPDELLLEGAQGEYVFAEDAMARGTLKEDLQRVIDAPIDAVGDLPVGALAKLAGSTGLQLDLEDDVDVVIGGKERTIAADAVVTTSELPALFSATGSSRRDVADLQVGLWSAALEAGALRAANARTAAVASAAAAVSEPAEDYVAGVMKALTAGDAEVARMPSGSRVAEGQFAFVPNAEQIMADITRKSPDYSSQFTVAVRNGSGRVGAADAVIRRLSILDVNLAEPTNADSFDYRKTQILAGSSALGVARDIRAILGRGVVLEGTDLAQNTVVVIVGADLAGE